jgi:hypothetical protein
MNSMTTFDERKQAQENKFAHDEELRFKARARGAKLFGAWVGEKIGVPPEGYAAELVNLVTAGKDDAALITKAGADAKAKGQDLSKDLLAEKLNRCLAEAKDEVLKQ